MVFHGRDTLDVCARGRVSRRVESQWVVELGREHLSLDRRDLLQLLRYRSERAVFRPVLPIRSSLVGNQIQCCSSLRMID